MTTNSPNSIVLVWRLNRSSEETPQGVFNRNLDSIHVPLEVIDELNSMGYYTIDRKTDYTNQNISQDPSLPFHPKPPRYSRDQVSGC